MTTATQAFERSYAVRKAYAKQLFEPEAMISEIEAAADAGHRSAQLHQEFPYTLQNTAAAQAAEEWLDLNGYRYVWQTVYVPWDVVHPNSAYEYLELEIQW